MLSLPEGIYLAEKKNMEDSETNPLRGSLVLCLGDLGEWGAGKWLKHVSCEKPKVRNFPLEELSDFTLPKSNSSHLKMVVFQ